MTRTEIGADLLEQVYGGTVNKKFTPTNINRGIDLIINDKNYDAIAQWIADKLNEQVPRSRAVDNSQDINDFLI